MRVRSNSRNVCTFWRHCKAPLSAKRLHPLKMRATLRTSSCYCGTSTSEFVNAFLRTPSPSRAVSRAISSQQLSFFRATICLFAFLHLFGLFSNAHQNEDDIEQYMPTRCESCQLFARELETDVRRLAPKMSRDEAEAWLIDELEQVCGRMLAYRLHKERKGLARFDKEPTGTAKTIKQLKERGVQVKMDVADELLDHPSIESGHLKDHCEWMLEEFERDIEHWFIRKRGMHQKTSLERYLCGGRLADEFDGTCAHLNRDEL